MKTIEEKQIEVDEILSDLQVRHRVNHAVNQAANRMINISCKTGEEADIIVNIIKTQHSEILSDIHHTYAKGSHIIQASY